MSLKTYHQKRKFKQTPEPKGAPSGASDGPLMFVVQKHHATQLHYDFRLELVGVLKSWAVPKGPSLNPVDKRLAMLVEDHPIEYAGFEGIIPKGNYGAGTVMVWDKGLYSPLTTTNRQTAEKVLNEQFKKGHLTFALLGEKLHGEFALVKAHFKDENTWLLIKAADEYATKKDVLKNDRSVISGRSMDEIASQAKNKGEVWFSKPKNLDLSDAPKSKMPHHLTPMLAQTRNRPFNDPNWLFEIKWDGYRAVAEIAGGEVELYSRNQVNYNRRFVPVVESLKKFPGTAVLDGEVVVLDKDGHPSFQLLQDYPKSAGELVYYVFDILHLDGHDLTRLPLIRRKEILGKILPDLPQLRLSEHIPETGKKFFNHAHKLRLEGIIAKNAQSPYRAGKRSDEWLKIKTGLRQEAVIAGFTRPNGNRKYFGALVLGVYKRGKLKYVGHTGGGFNDQNLEAILGKLQPLVQSECPFEVAPPTNAPVTWVKPKLICEVSFKEWTSDRKMRHPIFLGMRDDKNPREVEAETTSDVDSINADQASADTAIVKIGKQTLSITHPHKIFWPREKYTKTDLIRYYTEISPIILPYLKDRPQSMLRFPHGINGENFYQKDAGHLTAPWLKKVAIHSESGDKTIPYLLCQDLATLVYMINLGCIDFNPWNSRIKHLDHPDYLILDLDPEKAAFSKVIQVAQVIRKVLEDLEITSFPKTSGKRGMHIYIPMGAKYTYDQVRQFAQLLCLRIQARLPRLVSLVHNPDKRRGKVYLDYLRNGRGQTTASVYSVRAYPKATVSTPLKWEEITPRLKPDKFTIRTMSKRLEKYGDLFRGVMGKGINIKKILKRIEETTISIL
jgi:bifunctional non-homologous end joining protein LigD